MVKALKTPKTPNRLDELIDALVVLRLPVMADALRMEVQKGPPEGDTRLDYLWRLVEPQLCRRRENAIARRIQLARFPALKSLDGFDFDFQPHLDRDLVFELATLDFLRRGQNALFGGMSGTGKSHIAISLGYLACAHGFRVRYTTSADMLANLYASLATHSLTQALQPFLRCQLLIIDEVGLDSAERDTSKDAGLFYKVVQHRYDNGASTVITTNIDWQCWGEYLGGDSVATSAILDRLIHCGYAITIDGPSWRAEEHKRLNQRPHKDHDPLEH